MSEINDLIYGKDNTARIVQVEQEDGVAKLFLEHSDRIEIHEVPSKHWALSNQYHTEKAVRLKGKLHYKFGYQFATRREYQVFKNTYGKHGDVYGIGNAAEQCMVNKGITLFKGLRLEDVSLLSFDIETTGLEHNDESKILLISNTFRKNGKITKRLFAYDEYDNCAHMVQTWAAWVREIDPSNIIFHNGFAYDLPYIRFCHDKYSDEPIILGRCSKPLFFSDYESKYRVDGTRELSYKKVYCYGRNLIDTMFLAYKYDAVEKKYESYGLKKIIAQEGLEKKDRVFYDAGEIRHNYLIPEEWVKIKAYAIDDADDSITLYDLMAPPQFYLTQSVPKTFQEIVCSATGSQINAVLVRGYLQNRHSIPKADPVDERVEGGISFAIPGVYKNLFKIDIKSCYPSQILRFKLHEERKDPDANYFKLVEYFTLQRFEYKKKVQETGDSYYKNLDAAAKIFINSAYGVTNTRGLNFNSSRLADKITSESRAVIDMALRWASGKDYQYWNTKFFDTTEEKLDKRHYLSIPHTLPVPSHHDFIIGPSDTDSISFCKSDGSEMSVEERKELLSEINAISPEKILWEDDNYYKTVCAVAAKNYILWDGKKLKIKGSALKGSTKSAALKEFTRKVIDLLVKSETETEMHNSLKAVYSEYVAEAMNVQDIKRWSARKTLSSTMVESERANETRVMDALKGSNYREGDRFWCFFKTDKEQCLSENFTGEYNKTRLLKNLYDTVSIFDSVLPVKELFLNYALKKNYKLLETQMASVNN